MKKQMAIVPIAPVTAPAIAETEFQVKKRLAVKTVDTLMSRGQIGEMLRGIAAMVNIPEPSISLILPQSSEANTRSFLNSLQKILKLVQDDQVSIEAFIPELATEVENIKRISKEEK